MNTKEIGEIRRHIRRDRSNMTAIYGCYVNENKEIISQFRQSTGMMSENEGDKYFDTKHPRYVKAYKTALDKLIKTGKPFEINTGVISRGYKSTPYPSSDIIKIIKENGGTLMLNSDAHHEKNVAYQFDIWQKLL